MSSAAEAVASEGAPVYADLSHQFVPFEESDSSATIPPVADEDETHSKESPENCIDNGADQSAGSEHDACVVKSEKTETADDVRTDEKAAVAAAPKEPRRSRRRIVKQGGGNGLCPPHPPESVPVVNWTEPNEIKHIFPKTYNYAVCARARYSSQYLTLAKWRKEFDFYYDKYEYWCDIIQRKRIISGKEITKAKQLVAQLRWLLDHCWDGDESKPPVPEMLWRARKEEARRCEQLLIRKEYYRRETMETKSRAALLEENDDDEKGYSAGENARNSFSITKRTSNVVGYGDGVANVPKMASPCSYYNVKKAGETQEDWAPTPSNERVRSIEKRAFLFSLLFMACRWKKVLEQLERSSEIANSATGSNVLQIHLEAYIKDLVLQYDQIKGTDDYDREIIDRMLERNALLKEEIRGCGLEWLTTSWVIFESKLPIEFRNVSERKSASLEPSETPTKFPQLNNASTLLKVRDYLDDDGKSGVAATSKREQTAARSQAESRNGTERTGKADGAESGAKLQASGLAVEAEIPRPVAVKPVHMTEDERNRMELQEVVAVETLWARFAKNETPKFKDDKPILDAIEAVLRACRSYRAVLEVPLPKTIADIRRGLKLRNIHEAVALLQNLIIQRHEAKTGEACQAMCHIVDVIQKLRHLGVRLGRRVDLTPFETPETRRFRARLADSSTEQKPDSTATAKQPEFTSQTLSLFAKRASQNSGRQEQNEVPPAKKQKQQSEKKETIGFGQDEPEAELSKPTRNEGGVETLASNRPKRHIKAPNRFIFDDEEKEEQEKRKKEAQLKAARTNNSEMAESPKGSTLHSTGRRRKCEQKSGGLAQTSMELSSMETIVVIPEDDSAHEDSGNRFNANNEDEMILEPDIIDITTAHEFRCDPDGIMHGIYRYVATFANGTTKEVSRREYELWANRKVAEKEINAATKEQTAEEESATPKITQQEEEMSCADSAVCAGGMSSDQMTDSCDASPSVCSNDSTNRLLSTEPCNSQSIVSRSEENESSEKGDFGPWRQIAFRKEASLNVPLKMDKLKTQYDHLLMISEKSYLKKLCSEWIHVPNGGPFDDEVKHIRQMLQELEDVLNRPTSSWKDYFNMKKYLQTQIDSVIARFNALFHRDAPAQLPPGFNTVQPLGKASTTVPERRTVDVARPNSN